MNVYFQLFPCEPGAHLPLNHLFQLWIHERVTSLITPSTWFSAKYGEDWTLTFNISAHAVLDNEETYRGRLLSEASESDQRGIARYRSFTPEPLRVELRGPGVYKKDKQVEYTIFLPFRKVLASADPLATAFDHVFAGVYTVLKKMEIDVSRLRAEQAQIVEEIRADPKMFDEKDAAMLDIDPSVWCRKAPRA